MTVTRTHEIPTVLLGNYFSSMIGQFYKILPMWEDREKTLPYYMCSLENEMLGNKWLIEATGGDSMYMSLLGILSFLQTGEPELPEVRREVFKAISICKKLKEKYGAQEV